MTSIVKESLRRYSYDVVDMHESANLIGRIPFLGTSYAPPGAAAMGAAKCLTGRKFQAAPSTTSYFT